MQYRRKISANEHLYLAAGLAFSDLIIKAHIVGRGQVHPRALQDAINLVAASFPGASLKKSGSFWIADSRTPQVNCISELPAESSELFELIDRAFDLNPVLGPSCDVLLYSDKQETHIIFRALHAHMDGAGLDLWVKAVFAALRSEAVSACLSPTSEDQIAFQVAYKPLHRQMLWPKYCGLGGLDTLPRALDTAITILYGHVPELLGKLCLGIHKVLQSDPKAESLFMIPCDLRRHIDPPLRLSTANLSLPIFAPVNSNSTEQTLLANLLEMIEKREFLVKGRYDCYNHHLPKRLLAQGFKRLWDLMLKKNRYLVSATISHVGRRKLADYSCEKFQASQYLAIPCTIPLSSMSLIVSEDDRYTRICLVQPKRPNISAEELLSTIVEKSSLSYLRPKNSPIVSRTNKTLHEMFERQVRLSPSAICFINGNDLFTYAEFNCHANQLARALIDQGIKKGDRIGLALERGFGLYASMFAILKAGGCFVFLDLDMPRSRLTLLAEDSGLRFILCLQQDESKFSDNIKCFSPFENLGSFDSSNLGLAINEQDSCYIIYTSGSTGHPKGVVNYHAGLVNHFEYLRSIVPLGKADKTLQKTPLSFDAALLEVFLPLFCGACIYITSPKSHKDLGYISKTLDNQHCSLLCCTPSYLDMLMDFTATPNTVVRWILVGGEAFSWSVSERASKIFPRARIFNLYGPCEAAIDSLVYEIGTYDDSTPSVPIGKPIGNMQAYVVNDNMQLNPPGKEGELLIAGPGVGGPYIGSYGNSKKFLSNPFDSVTHPRAYKTGDIVKELSCGNIQYLGRLDHQVKIWGVRIELEEIESHMNRIDGIKQALVLAASNAKGKPVLQAHYCCVTQKIDARVIRNRLAQVLPEAMVPKSYTCHYRLPLNKSGKLDRFALTADMPASSKVPMRVKENKSCDPLDRRLRALWSQELGCAIDNDSDFFCLGGDSILAVSLVNKISRSFNQPLDLQMLYQYSTYDAFLKELASQLKPNHDGIISEI